MNPMQGALQEPRKPYVRFEQKAVEKRTPEGGITYIDTDFVFLTQQGSKDTVIKKVQDWLAQIKVAAQDGMYPPGWIPQFEEMYRLWRETRKDPTSGTPVKNWPAISAAECAILLHADCRSIEDLAQANEEFLQKIGMGARRLKQMAQDWVQANQSQGPLLAQMDAMRQAADAMELRVKALEGENEKLRGQLTAASAAVVGQMALPSPEERLANIQSADSSSRDDLRSVDSVIDEVLDA